LNIVAHAPTRAGADIFSKFNTSLGSFQTQTLKPTLNYKTI